MKVVILAGGYGTRLSEETEILPKPMIEIGGRPLLWHLMKAFSEQGYNDFVVALGYKGDVIKRYFMHYADTVSDLRIDLSTGKSERQGAIPENWKIELVDTGQDTMTGGRLKKLREHLGETFIFTYGDGLSTVDVSKLVAFHRAHGKLATVTAVQPPSKFGILQMNGNSVTKFAEKPAEATSYINGGFFVLEPEAIDRVESDDMPWEREPCETLAADGQLQAYVHDGYWQCVDTLHELRLLRNAWNDGEAPWKIWS
ncbi:MAG: glucose-1-phosphate cytidylyltransferase [Gammaproteobacteria bacterium]|nr:glucose-1-phosphate cytidylyltransferase [Gammaproteobacteria bacterium]MBU2676232.1 glucose-1-phosphate cytidylyltransferase [Gammaproteobacteria bacterium]NNC55933.1 glucose-1-phosphate cytidylyltransferase [Woeseiaceae bacterium]NNL49968.1 glucose-1-phosphate cytidylyltransferase [Woeseiaceae bacterium]